LQFALSTVLALKFAYDLDGTMATLIYIYMPDDISILAYKQARSN
jgi:hypothetical protein